MKVSSIVSVPSFGDSFFMLLITGRFKPAINLFPSPHSGILFLLYGQMGGFVSDPEVVSVPSFGDSFFIGHYEYHKRYRKTGFRPLIRGFFFYLFTFLCFLYVRTCFRPLIRGFFFYVTEGSNFVITASEFPSPHSGILFLSNNSFNIRLPNAMLFPSPHSGILFL